MIDAVHSLSFDDRDFIMMQYFPSFLRTGYDGKSNILEKEQITKNSDLNSSVSLEAKKGSELAVNKLSLLTKDLLKDLNYAGVTIDAHQLTKVINKIITRLEIIKTSDPQNINILDPIIFFFI